MPLFEYRCADCGADYEILHRTKENPDIVSCPSCASKQYRKKMSSFAATGFSSSPVSPCESGSCGIPASSPCAGGMCGLN